MRPTSHDAAVSLVQECGGGPTEGIVLGDKGSEDTMAKAIWEGAVLAESDDTVIVEGNHYFPADSIDPQYFKPSSHKSVCFWKGEASYYDLEVNGKRNENAAWFYPKPFRSASEIQGRIAFWKGVQVQAQSIERR